MAGYRKWVITCIVYTCEPWFNQVLIFTLHTPRCQCPQWVMWHVASLKTPPYIMTLKCHRERLICSLNYFPGASLVIYTYVLRAVFGPGYTLLLNKGTNWSRQPALDSFNSPIHHPIITFRAIRLTFRLIARLWISHYWTEHMCF